MAKNAMRDRAAYQCTECGHRASKWVGRCPECQAWGSIDELGKRPAVGLAPGPITAPALPIADVSFDNSVAVPTRIGELDRVLGGGLVPGSVLLLAGEPGVGKSTLLLELAHRYVGGGAGHGAPPTASALVVTGEESAAQVRLRAQRIGALHDNLYLAAENDLAALLSHVDAVQPGLLIVDSVQTISSGVADGAAGGVTQVRAVAAELIAVAKARNIATIIVGHVTKDGGIAGPRVLEHLVDVVLQFDGERSSALRLIRATKNRFGPADEIGCFEMYDGGVRELPDPSGLFVSQREEAVAGTCVTVVLEGRRPLITEVQSLVTYTPAANPRRAVSGLDAARIAMILAVTQRRWQLKLHDRDVFVATVGGARIREPAADLAIALAVASAARDIPLPRDLIAIGEVGLAGDVRPVGGVPRRLAEAARLGFRTAVVPAGWAHAGDAAPAGLTVIEVTGVAEAAARTAALLDPR